MLVKAKVSGFTLVEMAVVLAIVALLLGGLIVPLSAQIDLQKIKETRKALDDVKEALFGFAIANGRLPCPASSTSNGQESFCTTATGACTATTTNQAHGKCSNPYDGFVPAVALGITPIDAQGFMLDGWNNRIHYAVTNVNLANVYTFTAPGAMKSVGIANLNPDLYVCASSPNPATPSQSITSSCGPATILTSTAPAVIYSTGKNSGYGGSGKDELANANSYPNSNGSYTDNVFVSHDIALAGGANGEFDDIVIWLSSGILTSRMLAAGQLP